MMKKRVSRFLAAVLCLVMALSLFVPALAATPMGGEVAEVPVESAGAAPEPSHSHAVADTPAILAAAQQEYNWSSDTNSSFFTVTGGNTDRAAALTATVNGVSMSFAEKKALKLNSKAKVEFTTNAVGDLHMVISNQTDIKVDETTVDATNSVAVLKNLAAGSHTVLKASGETYLHYILWVPASCTHNNWDAGVVTKPATCTAKGVKTFTCQTANCGLTKTEEIPMIAHDYTKWVTVTEATCAAAGLEKATCTVCGAENGQTRPIDKLQHAYDPGKTICKLCGWDTATNTYHTEHVGDWTDVPGKAATCTAKGEQTRTCTACGKVETRPTDKIAHNFDSSNGGKCTMCGHTEEELQSSMKREGGGLESAFIEWTIGEGVGKYTVEYKLSSASTWTQIDDELIRQYPGYMRADALGLKAGAYQMRVIPDGKTAEALTSGILTVEAHDRSGYAFFGGRNPGAYNLDGTLKANTKVVYITQETASTVKLSVKTGNSSVEVTGLPGISLAYGKGKETAPLCIRIIGTVANDYKGNLPSHTNALITGTNHEGVAVSLKDKEFKGDLAFKASAAPITIEGVGNDAVLYGIGLRFKDMNDVEVRNLASMNCNSDEADSVGFQPDCKNVWVHNCDIFYGMPGSDADQAKGDGALDTKGVYYATLSYNHFWDSGKANLCGLDDDLDYLTYHHNWYDHSDSRHPRIRYSEHTHVYNNYYDGNAKYGVGATTGSSNFVENNYFRNCPKPMLISMQGTDIDNAEHKGTFSSEAGGMIKAYGNILEGSYRFVPYSQNSVEFDAYVASSKTEKVPSSVTTKLGGTAYNNFDTDPAQFYDYALDVAEDVPAKVMATAGRMEGGDFYYEIKDGSDVYDSGKNIQPIAELHQKINDYKSLLVKVGGTVDGSAGGDDPIPTEVDKSALETAISNANTAKAGVAVSANGSDVLPGTSWVPQSAMTALETAISEAESVNADETATQVQVNNVAKTLNSAVTAFNSAKADGRKLASDVLEGTAKNLPYTVTTDGAVTVTDTIPANNLVFATYWNGDKFLGAKTVTHSAATTAVSGWTSIKLIWIDDVDAPQCLAKTITK